MLILNKQVDLNYSPKWEYRDKNITLIKLLDTLKIKKWNKEQVNNLLFVGLGGIGDEFIFSRYGKILKEYAITLDYTSTNGLDYIINQIPYFNEVWNVQYTPHCFEIDNEFNINKFKKYDAWYSPFFEMDSNNNGVVKCLDSQWQEQYLFNLPEFDEKWRYLTQTDKPKIGIRFAGNFRTDTYLRRTLPVEEIVSMFNKNYKLFSLQVMEGIEKSHELDLQTFENEINNWYDTFSFLKSMDIVITSCSSVAHASAILGVQTFVLVPYNSYFIWKECDSNNHHSSWYDKNVFCLRQHKKGDWSYPLQQLEQYLGLTVNKKKSILEYV